MKEEVKYKIISLLNDCKKTGYANLQVQVCGTGRTFTKTAYDLYKDEWLSWFSKNDAAYIGVLMATEKVDEKSIRDNFPLKEKGSMPLNILITALMTAFLIIANIGSIKLAHFQLPYLGSFNVPSSVIFFPFIFVLTDISTELYGFKQCRRMIWSALGGLTLVILGLQISINMPASPVWFLQDSYQQILGQSLKIFVASSCAFLLGDITNAYLLSRLKRLTSGKFFLFRALGSTFIGAIIDSFIFINMAYFGEYSFGILSNLIFTESLIKVAGEAIILPVILFFTYTVSKFFTKNKTKEFVTSEAL